MEQELHKYEHVNNYCRRMNVPGGWIYIFMHATHTGEAQFSSSTFVPLPREADKERPRNNVLEETLKARGETFELKKDRIVKRIAQLERTIVSLGGIVPFENL